MKLNFFKFYLVYKDSTNVVESSLNDFKSGNDNQDSFAKADLSDRAADYCEPFETIYNLPSANEMYYGFPVRTEAMKYSKKAALRKIDQLISDAENAILLLRTYRQNNYDNLNLSLLDPAIRKLEREMNIK